MGTPTHAVESQGARDDCNYCAYDYINDQPARASPSNHETDTLTETTFSPHSPTTSSFAGAARGLAPRPPFPQRPAFATSFLIPAATATAAIESLRMDGPTLKLAAEPSVPGQPGQIPRAPRVAHRPGKSTSSRSMEPALAAAPASPDVPRGPPASHRQPLGNAAVPYYAASQSESTGFPGLSWTSERRLRLISSLRPVALDGEMGHEANYTTSHRDEVPSPSGKPTYRTAGLADAPLMVPGHEQPTELATSASARRKKFANDRSPLQRLELTLDSLTKEEKRARVQSAEQRARERAARRAAPVSIAEGQGRQTSASHQVHPPQATTPYFQTPEATALPGPLNLWEHPSSLTQSQESSQSRLQSKLADHGHSPPLKPVVLDSEKSDMKVHGSDLPKRNLSFRARAARNELETESSRIDSGAPPTAFFTGRINGIAAHVSNAEDGLRGEPSRGLPQITSRTYPVRERGQLAVPNVSIAPRGHIADMNKELPLIPEPDRAARPRFTEPVFVKEYERVGKCASKVSLDGPVGGPGGHAHPELAFGASAGRPGSPSSGHVVRSTPKSRAMNMMPNHPENDRPGDSLYKQSAWLDDIQKATVGSLEGTLLDINTEQFASKDKNTAWWEDGGGPARSTHSTRPRRAETFHGEYDDTSVPTRFKPSLYLQCGPLLRYCGIRQEKVPGHPMTDSIVSEREIWRGSIMIVTRDSESSYDIVPMLRLFVQDISLLPSPPHQVDGDLPPEYVDPIAGHPKLGRRGETLYVRPVEHLQEAKDLSRDETDKGLFESSRSPPDASVLNGMSELPQSFAGRQRRIHLDGEKLQKYKDVRGFRLHAERGCTFWRFNIEVELRAKQQRVAYRINRGPCMAFWVPPRAQTMSIMFHTCNGFSSGVDPDHLSGPDPMWRDVLNTHQSHPFHVMIGGGDQIYNDSVADDCPLFDDWLDTRNSQDKCGAAFTADMQDEMEKFYLERYCAWFSRGLFALAASQIPMVNMYNDHDIFDGYGSYPDRYMRSPVFAGLGAVAFKYYMLFQHQSLLTETENTEPSWILGQEPGPYIQEVSRSVYVSMGGKVALFAVDCRTERTGGEVISRQTWEKMINCLYAEVRKGQVDHLLVLLGIPIAYPRLVWLENILTSRLLDPVKALGRTGMLGKALNNIDGGVEILDDLNDHWTTKNHKQERCIIIEDLQDLAIDKSLRITILSGDVHLAAVGQLYSNPKASLAKHRDPRYMVNVVSSAIANGPPSDMLADMLNKRNKIHHFDKDTDESMMPLFQHGVDGRLRKNKHLLPHRNWCSIRTWTPGMTPPPTPPPSARNRSPSPLAPTNPDAGLAGRGGVLARRTSLGGRHLTTNPSDDVRAPAREGRPPVSSGIGGLLRSLSRRRSSNGPRPAKLTRTLSLDSGQRKRRGFFRSDNARPDDGGINGQWGDDSDDDASSLPRHHPQATRPSGLRGGGAHEAEENSDDDGSYLGARSPQRTVAADGLAPTSGRRPEGEAPMTRPRPFHRTPTGLSIKQRRRAEQYEVDLEGGLDICLNVEVNARDPAGITVPYRLLVPRLQYEYSPAKDDLPRRDQDAQQLSGLRRFLSLRKKPAGGHEAGLREQGSDLDSGNGSRSDLSSISIQRR